MDLRLMREVSAPIEMLGRHEISTLSILYN